MSEDYLKMFTGVVLLIFVIIAYFHERRSLNNPLCQHSCRLNFLRR